MFNDSLQASSEFESLLSRLAEARMAHDQLLSESPSLAERSESQDRLARIRAEIARARAALRVEEMLVIGTHDSRTSHNR